MAVKMDGSMAVPKAGSTEPWTVESMVGKKESLMVEPKAKT